MCVVESDRACLCGAALSLSQEGGGIIRPDASLRARSFSIRYRTKVVNWFANQLTGAAG